MTDNFKDLNLLSFLCNLKIALLACSERVFCVGNDKPFVVRGIGILKELRGVQNSEGFRNSVRFVR